MPSNHGEGGDDADGAADTERDDGGDDDSDDGGDDDGDDGGGGGDDIYIMMQCVCVCLSRKIITSSWESPVTTQVGFS